MSDDTPRIQRTHPRRGTSSRRARTEYRYMDAMSCSLSRFDSVRLDSATEQNEVTAEWLPVANPRGPIKRTPRHSFPLAAFLCTRVRVEGFVFASLIHSQPPCRHRRPVPFRFSLIDLVDFDSESICFFHSSKLRIPTTPKRQ